MKQTDPFVQGSHDGESYQPSHGCTDPLCCLLFAISIAVWGACYGYGWENGNVAKMFHGINGTNGICGVSQGVEDRPFLYWCADWSNGMPSVSGAGFSTGTFPALSDLSQPVCVASCPGVVNMTTGVVTVSANTPVPECAAYGANMIVGYKTINFLDRYCLPDVKEYPQLSGSLGNMSAGQLQSKGTEAMESLSSVADAWMVLVLVFVLAIVLSYLYMTLLKCCAEPIMKITMAASIVGFIGLGAYLWLNAADLRDSLAEQQQYPADLTDNMETASKVVAVLCWVIGGALFCVLCCFCSSITMAAKCVEAACHAVWDMPFLLLTPLLKAFVKAIFFIVIIYGFLLCWTTADPVSTGVGFSRRFEHSGEELGIIAVYTFVSLWILAFLHAWYEFVVAYMVVDYYYCPIVDDRKQVECCKPMCEALHYGLFTHAGSLAFGSLLIAILEFIQKVVEYAEKKNREGGNIRVISCILGCILCCVGCCKEIVEYVNKNAYIDIAIQGSSFCEAARNAIKIIIDQGGAMAILNGATWVFAFFGTVFVTVICGVVSHVIVTHGSYADMTNTTDAVPNPIAVMLVCCLIAFVVALGFMHVFDMASDTLIYCVGYDRLQHPPRNFKAYAPYPLQDLLDEHRHLG